MPTSRKTEKTDPSAVTGTWEDSALPEIHGLDVEAMTLERLLHAAFAPAEDRHALREQIGKGGMGEVSIALDRRLHRPVALKQVEDGRATDVRSVASFIHEARLAARLDHPNIVPVHDLGIRDGHRVFFTMKLVEGEDLAHKVRREGLEGRTHDQLLDLVEVMIKVCDALASAHAQGIVHCDVKPHNIMVGNFGAVYLMDWGLARDLDRNEPPPPPSSDAPAAVDESWLDMPENEGAAGTPGFMPPEQARGEPVDHRSDVFAVGAALYYVLTGQAPFSAPTRVESLRYATRCAFRAPSELRDDIPSGLEAIVMRAMSETRAARYEDVTALREALVGYSRGGGDFPRVRFSAGEDIVRQGESGDAAFIIVSGECEVLLDGEQIRIMGSGEVFGETAILAEVPRTATVRALGEVVLMQVKRGVFEREVDRMSPWMGAFTRTLAQRLAER